MNAEHARDFAGCTKQETIELLRRGAARAAQAVRALSDDDLSRKRGMFSDFPDTAFAARVLFNLSRTGSAP